MSLRILGTSIPPSKNYPGLIARKITEPREILVLGWGEEAERVANVAVVLAKGR